MAEQIDHDWRSYCAGCGKRLDDNCLSVFCRECLVLCPHGQRPADCNDCMVESDFLYDQAREDRHFGKG